MARWQEIAAAEPDLVEKALARFEAHEHKTIATLRRDGSPRISGIELIIGEGDVWFGSMRGAVKALDLQRDPRYAVHSGSDDPPGWAGDAKLAGRAEEIHSAAVLEAVMQHASEGAREGDHVIEAMHLFRLEISELVWVGLNDARDKMVVDSWNESRGRRTAER